LFEDMREIEVAGRSMDLAGLLPGARVLVQPTARARDGDVVVARLDGDELVVKRLQLRHGDAWLVPESSDPHQVPRRLGPSDAVVGVVVNLPRPPAALAWQRRLARQAQAWRVRAQAPFPRPEDACTELDFLWTVPVAQDDMAGRGLRRGDQAGVYRMGPRSWRDGVLGYVDLRRHGLGVRFMQLLGDGKTVWAVACPDVPREKEPAYEVRAQEVLGYVRNTRAPSALPGTSPARGEDAAGHA
jgi:hypothetical protein